MSEVVLTGLSSGMQYRFRVAAISSIGCAVSPPSAWVTTPESVKAAVRMHELKIVNAGQVVRVCRVMLECDDDVVVTGGG